MNAPVLARSVASTVSRTAMAKDVFGRYMPEKKERVREVNVQENETLKQLKNLWINLGSDFGNLLERYQKALKAIKDSNISYSAKDIEMLSIALASFEDDKKHAFVTGIFFSSLINNGAENDYVIHTGHSDARINFFGYRNTKNIIVKGEVGNRLGSYMQSGNITVEGNAGLEVGAYMQGGKITIKGNATNRVGDLMEKGEIIVEGNVGSHLGTRMQGGKITIRGDAGYLIGMWMHDGEIHIEGNPFHFDDEIYGGRIFHKGKLIYENGEEK